MVQVYMSLNILKSNITYGTGTKYSWKVLQLVKKFISQKKRLFGWWKRQSSGTTAILCLGNPWPFLHKLSRECGCGGNFRGIQIRQILLYSKATPLPTPRRHCRHCRILFTVRLVTVPRQLPKIITVNMSAYVVTCPPDIRIWMNTVQDLENLDWIQVLQIF